jgi:CheY-like chemotaxis protein
MRILVADQNALLLAAITATFGPHCDLVTATRRDVCLAQLEQHRFDVVIAGDKLSDYTGLELLSEVPVISPDTLLIFAADARRLQQLGKRLAVFGLFEAVSYPLTPQKLVDVLRRAREKLQASRPLSPPKVRHVVLESEWDTGERLALIEREAQEADEADDFVFAGPPTVPEASSAASAERILEGTPVVSAAGVPDAGATPHRATMGRTFEGTPVVVAAASEAVVTEYEVKPSPPALPHHQAPVSASIESDSNDEFVFETGAQTAIHATSTSAPVAQETAAEATEEDAGEVVDEEFDAELGFLCSNDSVFDVPEPPKWAEDGAANDTAYESKPPFVQRQRSGSSESNASRGRAAPELPAPAAALPAVAAPVPAAAGLAAPLARAPVPAIPARPASATSARTDSHTSEAAKPAPSSSKSAQNSKAPAPQVAAAAKGPPQPRMRTQTVTTDAQRAAFERALARRNSGEGQAEDSQSRSKAGKARPTIQLGSTVGVFSGLPLSGKSSESLSSLAKMASTKRPLSETKMGKAAKGAPNRAVFAVGSGVAAVAILGVLSFELLRHSSGEAEHHMPHSRPQLQATQVFSHTTTLMASSDAGQPAQLEIPPPPEGQPLSEGGAPDSPQPENFDPNTAPADPPPPPILEHPGPSEPPSMGHGEPPWANGGAQPWGTTSSDSQDSPNQ